MTPEPSAGTTQVVDQPMRYLILEDDDTMRAYLAEAVARHDSAAVADACANLAEVQALARQHQYDVALVDLFIGPHLDGITAAQLLKGRGTREIVFISGTGDPSIIAQAGRLQPRTFLAKPFKPSQLAAILTLLHNAPSPLPHQTAEQQTDCSRGLDQAQNVIAGIQDLARHLPPDPGSKVLARLADADTRIAQLRQNHDPDIFGDLVNDLTVVIIVLSQGNGRALTSPSPEINRRLNEAPQELRQCVDGLRRDVEPYLVARRR